MKSFICACVALALAIGAAISLSIISNKQLNEIEAALVKAESEENYGGIKEAGRIFEKSFPLLSLTVPDDYLMELERELFKTESMGQSSEEIKSETNRLICLLRQIRRQCGSTLSGIF